MKLPTVFAFCMVLNVAYIVYAQFDDPAVVEIRTVNVFPGMVEGDDWDNLETITFQNLESFSLYQEFNTINSASPQQTAAKKLQAEKQQQTETENNNTTDTATSTQATVQGSGTTNEQETGSTTKPTPPTSDGKDASTTEQVSDTTTTSAPSVDSVEEEKANLEVDSSDEQQSERTSDASSSPVVLERIDSMFSFVFAKITQALPFAQRSATTTVEESAVVEQATSSPTTQAAQEPEQVVVSTTTEAMPVSTTTEDILTSTTTGAVPAATSTETITDVATSTASTSPQQLSEDSVVTENDSAEGQVEEAASCDGDCVSYSIVLSDFGVPIFESGTELSGAQLRMSFAAKRKVTRDEIQSLHVQYSLDGGVSWDDSGSIIIDDEASNSINGGYYLFPLPAIEDEETLNQLSIRVVYEEDPTELEDLFIESAWLELFVTEIPDASERMEMELQADDNFFEGILEGDALELADGEIIAFENTDENEDETLIIKSDKKSYAGLSEAMTYFNVTNTSNSDDTFSIQTYFPETTGEVVSLEEWQPNKPRQLVIPEYRPFMYHCEAGWEYSGEPITHTLEDISKLFAEPTTNKNGTTTPNENETASSSTGIEEAADVTDIIEDELQISTNNQSSSTPADTDVVPKTDDATQTATTTASGFPLLHQAMTWVQATFFQTEDTATTSDIQAGVETPMTENATSTRGVGEVESSYLCRDTSVVRTCDSLEGDNTLCRVKDVKVREHNLTRYQGGWQETQLTDGELPQPGVFKKVKQFFGFAADKKFVPEKFVPKTHTPDTYTIKPGETKYFKMELSFPPLSKGEFWIEAVGESEYGLLDPFWSSQWQYRMPITLDNTNGATDLTEQQVFLEMDSSVSDFWSNVNSDGSDIRFVYEEPGNVATWYGITQPENNWYDRDWNERIPITIQSSQIDSVLSDFPVYVDLSDFDSSFFNAIQNDGDDIRITRSDGVTDVPFELVALDTGDDSGELYFKGTLSNSVDTTFYLYYDNPGADAYAVDDTYGAEKVWTNGYEAVYHLGDLNDSTTNNRNLTEVGTPTQTDGAYDFDGDTDFLMMPENFGNFDGASSLVLQARFNADAVAPSTDYATSPVLMSLGGENNAFLTFGDGEPGDTIGFRYEGWTTPVTAGGIGVGTEYALTFSYNQPGADLRMYLNGSETDSFSGTFAPTAGTYENYIGGLQTSEPGRAFDGSVSEVRILSNPLSAAWVDSEYVNSNTPTTFYNLATNESLPELEEIGQWSYRLPITIQASAIDAPLTDFPVYVDLSDFDSTFFENVQTDGDDIRIMLADNSTEVPYELVDINTSLETGQLHFLAPNLSDSVDTTFYIYFGNHDALGYAADDIYGAENVWGAQYNAVYHLEEDAAGLGNTGLYTDATSNNYDADDEVNSTGKTGKLGSGQEIRARESETDDYILFPSDTINGETQFTASFWLNTSQNGDQAILNAGSNNELIVFLQNTQVVLYDNGATDTFTLDTDVTGTGWKYFTVIRDTDNDQWRLYVDGQPDNQNPVAEAMNALAVPEDCFMMGLEQDGSCLSSGDESQHLDGLVDEIRFRTVVPTDAIIAAEFSNQNDSSNFYSVETIEPLQPTTFNELDFWVQHFDATAEEADIWVQADSIPAGTSTTVYLYYGNSSASSASDQYAPFTYSTTTDLYYPVTAASTGPIDVYSLIDDNLVSLDGGTPISLNAGETTSLAGYNSTSVISALGPISATINDDFADSVVPIAFATTTFAIPTNRNTSEYFIHAPLKAATVNTYIGNSGTPDETHVIALGNSVTSLTDAGGNNGVIIESSEPVLVYHQETSKDSILIYPPTTRDLFGIDSNNTNISTLANNPDPDVYCSSSQTASVTGINRGETQAVNNCTDGNDGTGAAMRFANALYPIAAIQQADGDGSETTSFWPQHEFSTEYIMAGDSAYAAIACSPRFGASTIEIQSNTGATIESGTCTPSGELPGKAYFNNGQNGDVLAFPAGYKIVATNDVPFYVIYEDMEEDNDETNILGAVQARKFTANPIDAAFGAQEVTVDAQYDQLSFGWYENINTQTPTSSWPVDEGAVVGEGESIADGGAINLGDVLRLRMNLQVGSATGTVGSAAFALQYAETEVENCSLADVWHDVGDIGSSTAAFSGYNNSSVTDGSILNTTVLTASTQSGTYEEENLTSFLQSEFAVGTVAEWDWVVENTNAAANTTYCFRMARSGGQALVGYTSYPSLVTSGPPNAPVPLVYFDNENTADTTPTLEFVGIDLSSDDIHYQVQIDDDVDFSSVTLDRDSISQFSLFENSNVPSDKAPFASASPITFTSLTSLAPTTTYWWRVRGRDPNGTDTWGEWSIPWSFTLDGSVGLSEWHQTTGDQFTTNTLSGLSTSSGAVSGSSGSMTSTAIDFDDVTQGNAWGEVSWNDTESSGTILYQVEYFDGSTWSLIPNSLIPNNNVGNGASPINLLPLSTDTYDTIRLVANFSGTTLSVQDWTVTWGERVSTPELGSPFDNQKVSTTTPTFTFTSTDPENDDLEYQVSYSTDSTFTSSTTVNGGTFTSAIAGNYSILGGSSLTNGLTYWWRVRARDPGGSNTWSPWSESDSFTIDDTVTVSTWFQTTQEQFRTGTLNGLRALGSDEVGVSNQIGEYGTVVVTNGLWAEVATQLSYNDPIVVTSVRYNRNTDIQRTSRVRNKAADSFEVSADNFDGSVTGTTTVDYIVLESGDWLLDDGGSGVRAVAGSELVSTVEARSLSGTIAGTTVSFSPAFPSEPSVVTSVTSNEDSTWVISSTYDGSNKNNPPSNTTLGLFLNRIYETAVHDPENVDYIAFEQSHGTNNSNEFDFVQDGTTVSDSPAAINFNSSFTPSAPGVTVVQSATNNGGDGGFAMSDIGSPTTASSHTVAIDEDGSGADRGHGSAEEIAIAAFEGISGIILRDSSSGGDLSGTITSEPIVFADGAGPKFETAYWNDTFVGASSIVYQIEYLNGSDEWTLIPDGDLPNNSTGTTTGPLDLSELDISMYDTIRLVAELACDGGDCPTIQDWTVEWSEGAPMSGTLQASDRTTNVTSGTIAVAVNGTLLGSTGSVSNGVWSVNNVTAFAGDVVTVFVTGADDSAEAVSVFVYDGAGDMTGVALFEGHLSLSADELGTTTNALLASYDNSVSANEDIFFDVNVDNDLTLCAVGACTLNSLYIGSGNVYIPDAAGSGNIETYNFVNDGVIELDGNTMRVGGSWDNNSVVSPDTSTVMFTATTTAAMLGTWYDTDWGYRLPITIDADQVDSTHTDFPVYVDLATLPSGFFSNVQVDGDDIRMTISDEVTEVPVELVAINTGGETGELHFKAPSLPASGDTTFYLYYGNPTASAYAASDTYGRNNVWTNNYEAVYHLGETGSGAVDEYLDSTGNGFDAQGGGGAGGAVPGTIGGVMGTAQDFDGGDDYIDTGVFASDMSLDGGNPKTISAWAYTDAFTQGGIWTVGASNNVQDYSLRTNAATDAWRAQFWGTDIDFTYDSDFKWVHFALDSDGATQTVFANGVDVANGTFGLDTTDGFGVAIGRWRDTDAFDGRIDEVRIATTNRDDAWYASEYVNQNTPNTFYTVGAQTATPLTPTDYTIEDASGVLPFYNLIFGENTSDATWKTLTTLDVNGTLQVNEGTYDRSLTTVLTIAGNLTLGADGQWSGTGTTTFDGSGSKLWSDNGTTPQTIGDVLVAGSGKTITLGSDVRAESLTVGASDTLNGGGANVLSLAGNFTNNNTFIPQTSTIEIIGANTDAIITTGGSPLYNLTASTTAGGSIVFTESSVALLGNFTIATGTVTLPTNTFSVGGSFSNVGGDFAHNNATVRFTGTGSETITLRGDAFFNHFYDATFVGDSTWSFLDTNATTTNNLSITNGTVTFPSGTLTVGADVAVSGSGALNHNDGELRLLVQGGDTLATNGSPLNDVTVQSGDASGSWYDEAWAYRLPITIDATAIDDDLSDFPVYVDLADLSPDFFTNVQADGGDIRITQADGVTEVPREIVAIDTSELTGEVHFKATSIASTTDTTFYVYYGNESVSDYATSATYGAENVWSNGFVLVEHMNDLTTSSVLNSANDSRNGTKTSSNNPVEEPAGKLYEAQDNSGDSIAHGNILGGSANLSFSGWVNADNLTGSGDISTYGHTIFAVSPSTAPYTWLTAGGSGFADEFRLCAWEDTATACAGTTGANLATGEWNFVAVSAIQGGLTTVRVNGQELLSYTNDNDGAMGTNFTVGDLRPGRDIEWDGLLDELRAGNVTRTNAWQDATYKNQSISTDFYTSGVQEFTAQRIFADTNLTVLGNLTLETGGDAIFPTGVLSVGGSFDNNASFNAHNGTVAFSSTAGVETIAAGVSNFYILNFNGVGGDFTVTEHATATNSITLNEADVFRVNTGIVLEAMDTFTNNLDNAETTWTGATLRLSSGNDITLNSKDNEGDDYGTLAVTDGGIVRMWNSTAAAYDTEGISSIYSQDHNGTDGDLYIFGEYVRESGTEYWNYATDFDGTDLVAGSLQRQANVRVANTASVLVATSSIEIVGDSVASTTIDAISGSFALALQNATIDAGHFAMTGTDVDGLQLTASSTITSLDDTAFTIAENSTALTVDASTVDNNPDREIFNTAFSSAGGNWYNGSWSNRVPITIQASQVDATVTDFPVYVDLSDLGAAFFSTVRSDGGDIRVTADDGVTELSREIVDIDTGGETGELHFKADTISSSVDTTFYLYFGNAAATDYASGATYGSEDVWSNNFEVVYHLEEDPSASAPQYIDSTGNSAGTAVNMEGADQVAAQAGSGAFIDGVDEHITTNYSGVVLDSTWSIFLNANGVQDTCDGLMFSRGTDVSGMNYGGCQAANELGYHWNDGAGTYGFGGGPVFPTGQWAMAAMVVESSQATLYSLTNGGVTSGANVAAHAASTIDGLGFGWDSFGDARSVSGTMDEVRLSSVARSQDWLEAEYNNLSSSGTFYVASAVETDAVATNVTLLGVPDSFWWFRDGAGNYYGETYDDDNGNPGAIRWDDSSYEIDVSGVVYADDGVTPLGTPTCNGSTQNVRIVVDGGTYTDTTSCSAADGSYIFTDVAYVGDPNVVIYLDTNGGTNGSVLTKTPTEDILDLDIYANRVMTRHEGSSYLTIADMVMYDEDDDTDIRFVATIGTPNTLTVRPDTELIVASNTAFEPDGTITLQSGGSGAGYDGTLHIDNDATFLSDNTLTHAIGGSLFVDEGAVFTTGSSTYGFTATTTGKTITANTALTFTTIEFVGIGGGWNLNTDLVVLNAVDVTAGTVTGTGDIEIQNGSISGDGLVSLGGGTVTINKTNTLGGVQGWTFNNLTLGSGLTAGITTPSSNATTTVGGVLTISSAHSLDAGTSVWNLTGSGTVFVEDGTFLEDTSTVVYGGSTNATLLSTNYYNLGVNAAFSAPTFTAQSAGFQVLNNLYIGGTSATTLTLSTQNPTVAVIGDVYIADNGTLVGSNSKTLTVSGSWDNDGSFISSSGLVDFASADTFDIAAGASSFGDVLISGTGAATVSEHATSTGSWTLAPASDFTVASGQRLAVGDAFTNSAAGAATTWTGSTLHLFGSGQFQINASTTQDSYATLSAQTGTHIRMWNSDANIYTTANGGSVYSMDHEGTTGDLYIFGDYNLATGNDYWSYGTDFDGTALSGGRAVDVYVENGGSFTYGGGSLEMLGTASATTTVQVQGGGIYSADISGGTINAQYYLFQDVDSNGLTFTGAPIVTTLSNGTFIIGPDNARGMTIDGSVIDANPAKNFANNVFQTQPGVTTAVNASTTGTTVSSWRFTTHSGAIDGEDFDADNGDPGYLVWDNSTPEITISGHVYENDGTTPSSVCGANTNIVLAVDGVVTSAASSTCDGSGLYSIAGVSFSPSDTLTLFINGEGDQGATISIDPLSSVGNMDIYEDHMIVRHEGSEPIVIADLADYDSSDDTDVPFTAIDAGTDTLTLDPEFKLIVWNGKTFAPDGDVTTGSGAGGVLDGTVALRSGATLALADGEEHTFGGSLETGSGATFTPAQSSVTFTSSGAGHTIDTNENGFYDVVINSAGSYTSTDVQLLIGNDAVLTNGTLTLPSATTTIGGSLLATGGAFDANGGVLRFTSGSSETITAAGSEFHELLFNGSGSWSMDDTDATTTANVLIEGGTVTLPSGALSVAGNLRNIGGSINHNTSHVIMNTAVSAALQVSGSDLYAVTFTGGGDFTMEDNSLALLDDMMLANGSLTLASGTLSIGGSFDATGGSFDNASGTILFNAGTSGKTISAGGNPFYNVQFGNPSGGWTVIGGATSTHNFTIAAANDFTLQSDSTLRVSGVFSNLVGGVNTTWTNTTLHLDSGSMYAINTKSQGGDVYEQLTIAAHTDISSWDSSATTITVDSSASLYAQDNAGISGDLYIYGDFHIATTTNYWSYARDFDGTALGGASRQANVYLQAGATTTVDSGGLQIVGSPTATTTIQNQGAGTYTFAVAGGVYNANYYSYRNLDIHGLTFSGIPTITSLSHGDFELALNGGSLITLSAMTQSANPSKFIDYVRFAAPALSGVNVNLSATTSNAWSFRYHTGNLSGEDYDIDGATDCGSIRWDDSSCLLIEQTHYRWRNDDGGLGVSDAEWFDGTWDKRKRVRIVNEDTASYATTAVKVVVTYDANMQSDFADLRFTASDGVTSIPYWIEKYTASTQATVWLQIPSLVSNGAYDSFMYYDNVTATTTSSNTQVFEASDDFEDDDIAEYNGSDTNKFQTSAGTAYGGSYALEPVTDTDFTNDGIVHSAQTVSQGQIIRYMQYVDTSPSGVNDESCTLFGVTGAVTNNQNYAVCLELFMSDRIALVRDAQRSDNYGSVTALSSAPVSYSTGWYEVEIDWQTNNDIDVSLYTQAGALVATTSATDSTYTTGTYGFTYWGQHGAWDSFTARNRTKSSPSAYFGGEQVDGGATWNAVLDSPSNNFAIGETARLRLAVENSGLAITDQEFLLEYAPVGSAPSCEAVSAGAYVNVPPSASCGSDAMCMATSSAYANGDAIADLLTDTNGTFIPGEATQDPSNTADTLDIAQNRYTELEFAVAATINASDSSYCFRVTDNGDDLDAYASIAEFALQYPPSMNGVSFNAGQDIALVGGTTTRVYATTTVTDYNGYTDLALGTTTMFTNVSGAACTPDNNDCYLATSDTTCSFTNCSGNSCTLQCYADFLYHADPTDLSGGDWYAFMEVEDHQGGIDFATSPAIDLMTLNSLSVEDVIAYGALAVSSTTGSYNPTSTIQNIGNNAIDINVEGTDLTDGNASVIPANQQRFATSSFDYTSCVTCTTLSTSVIPSYELDLAKPTDIVPPVEDTIYWGIAIPYGVASNPHSGVNIFYAVSD